jgi:anti-anti-sigma factor
VLISALKAARTTGGTVRLAQCQPGILQLLDLTGLSRVFPVYRTVQEARSDPLLGGR